MLKLARPLPFNSIEKEKKENHNGSPLDHYRLFILNRYRDQVYVSGIGAQPGGSNRSLRSYRSTGGDKLRACTTIYRADVLMRT